MSSFVILHSIHGRGMAKVTVFFGAFRLVTVTKRLDHGRLGNGIAFQPGGLSEGSRTSQSSGDLRNLRRTESHPRGMPERSFNTRRDCTKSRRPGAPPGCPNLFHLSAKVSAPLRPPATVWHPCGVHTRGPVKNFSQGAGRIGYSIRAICERKSLCIRTNRLAPH